MVANLLSHQKPQGLSQLIPERICQAFMELSKGQPCSGPSCRPPARPRHLEAFESWRSPAHICAPFYTLCQGRLLRGYVGQEPSIAFTCGAPVGINNYQLLGSIVENTEKLCSQPPQGKGGPKAYNNF